MQISVAKRDQQKEAAAQNAQEGLITVSDLSLLTGIAASQLTKFVKIGQLEHFGEYHGKRFFNFQTIVNWSVAHGNENVARTAIRKGMEIELLASDCPYFVEKIPSKNGSVPRIKLSWKVSSAA